MTLVVGIGNPECHVCRILDVVFLIAFLIVVVVVVVDDDVKNIVNTIWVGSFGIAGQKANHAILVKDVLAGVCVFAFGNPNP